MSLGDIWWQIRCLNAFDETLQFFSKDILQYIFTDWYPKGDSMSNDDKNCALEWIAQVGSVKQEIRCDHLL